MSGQWNSHSACSHREAERRIGCRYTTPFTDQTPVDKLIDLSEVTRKTADLKEKLYPRITDCIEVEDFPAGNIEPGSAQDVTDLAGIILIATVADFKRNENKPGVVLRREKTIVPEFQATDSSEEFLSKYLIEVDIDRYIVIVESTEAIDASTVIHAMRYSFKRGLQ